MERGKEVEGGLNNNHAFVYNLESDYSNELASVNNFPVLGKERNSS
jgi:hypothetical protein